MIVEDEHGNNIYLSDLDDNREPEEPEDEPPLDLDGIGAAHAAYLKGSDYDGDQAATVLLDAIPQMLAELRHWRSLTREQQHGVLHGDEWLVYGDAEDANEGADLRGGTAGVRDVYTAPWVQFSSEAPF